MAKQYDSIDELFQDVEATSGYAAATAALDFIADLTVLMREQGISKAELARRIGKSPAYVTKVLRAETNFTLRTMTELAHAVGGVYHNRICREGFQPVWLQQTARRGPPATASLRASDPKESDFDNGGLHEAKSATA